MPRLAPARSAQLSMQAAAAGDGKGGPLAKLRAKLPPPAELKKVTPLGAMFFFILFAYTILRDTKDVLVVTAPGSGAEIIPFLKTYVNLPGAIGFTVFYSWLSNKFSQQQVFTGLVSTFIAFFTLFAFVIYPNAAALHPTAAVDGIVAALPAALAGLSAPLAIIRNWTYAVFYTMAELWGSVVVSLLFWGFANQVTKVEEAKRYYPLFGLGANVALIFSGLYVRFVSGLRRTSTAADPWAGSLKLLMGGVSAAGLVVLALFQYMQKKVMTDPECVPPSAVKQSKTKTSMGIKESASYLASSPYIRDLATLVICYGMSINIVEVSWKAKLKAAFPNPNDYSEFMGAFSSCTGAVTLFMMLAGQRIFKYFGWGAAALVTPTMLFITGAIFFSLILFGGSLSPLVAALGTPHTADKRRALLQVGARTHATLPLRLHLVTAHHTWSTHARNTPPLSPSPRTSTERDGASSSAFVGRLEPAPRQAPPHSCSPSWSAPPKISSPRAPSTRSSTRARRWPTFPSTPRPRPRARPRST